MAILQKRTSEKKLPGAKTTLSNGRQLTSSVARPAMLSKPSATSITTPAETKNTTKPKVSTNTSAKTITTPASTASTKTSTAAKPKTTSPSSMTSRFVNAATGAALGVGAKKLIDILADKITSKPNRSKTSSDRVADATNKKKISDAKLAEAERVAAEANERDRLDEKAEEEYREEQRRIAAEEDLGDSTVSISDAESDAVETLDADESIEDFLPQYFEDEQGNIYASNADGSYDLVYDNYSKTAEDEETTDEDEFYEENIDDDYEENIDDGYEENIDDGYEENIDEETDSSNEYYFDDYAKGGLIAMMKHGGVLRYEDGGEAQGSDDFTRNEDGTTTYYYEDGTSLTYDFDGELVDTSANPGGRGITSAGGSGIGSQYPDDDTIVEGGNVWTPKETGITEKPWYQNLIDSVKDNPGAVASAGAGALVASLLGSDFSGDQYSGIDMSDVGAIKPRTTGFGVGPTNFVGYDDYGTSSTYEPNSELLKNLNAPGYNPVNEGDYGYEEAPAEVPKKASGGLSSASTPVSSYYTFGQPADILANLGMREQPPMTSPENMPQVGQPQQQPQQQPQPQQQAPQGMMPPQMRMGGLPQANGVPFVQGRADYRRGAAVSGAGDGQSDDIPAMLADGEYVLDSELVAQIGNGSTKAGAKALDRFRENIRAHKRSAPTNKIPPKTKALTSYLKG